MRFGRGVLLALAVLLWLVFIYVVVDVIEGPFSRLSGPLQVIIVVVVLAGALVGGFPEHVSTPTA